ncbi:MAG: nucleotidyltransferase family protein [bacterium]|nr:nucleotidyltransferase family protein [bacterium]
MTQIKIPKDKIAELCRKYHVTRLALFGSVLGPDFTPNSDVDILVEFEPGHVPGFKFINIEMELSSLLGGRKVDLVTPKFLNRRIRGQVLSSAEVCYAKG